MTNNPDDQRRHDRDALAARAAHAWLERERARRERDRLLARVVLYALLFLAGVVLAWPGLSAQLWAGILAAGGIR